MFSRYVLAHDTLPAVGEIRRVVEKVGVKPDDFSGNHIAGWVHGKLAVEALNKCGFPCNGEKLNTTLNTLSVDLGGLSGGPIAFKADDHQGTSWWKTYSFDPATKKFKPSGNWVEAPSKLAYTIGDKK